VHYTLQNEWVMSDKVLFIGASGFVGTRLIEITQTDFDVTNLDKQQSHFYPEISVSGDVRNQDQLDSALAG
jgi:nucleoside-diphosphate-sugar epimerase